MADKKTTHKDWMVMLPVAGGAIVYLLFVFLPGRQIAADLQSQLRAKTDYLAQSGTVSTALAAAEGELQAAKQYRDQRRAGT
ncbi:MAG: hypothetical protein U1E05_12865, partial [Patescibacteria group bacterium]|nr:hypothetical protein [Patescibacteria group bacterium]